MSDEPIEEIQPGIEEWARKLLDKLGDDRSPLLRGHDVLGRPDRNWSRHDVEVVSSGSLPSAQPQDPQ